MDESLTLACNAFLNEVGKYQVPIKSPLMAKRRNYLEVMEYYKARDFCTDRGMWAIVAMDWTKALAEWIGERKVLEVMAGVGWLAEALKQHGVNIVATDDFSWDGRHSKAKLIHPVIKQDAIEAIKEHKDADILLMSWPPYAENTATKILKKWGEKRPVIYIGEGYGGCNANDEFFELFEEDETLRFSIPQWEHSHDYISIGHLKRTSK